jgi:hypothetical protein
MATRQQIEELTSSRFPWAHPEDHVWINVHDGQGPKVDEIAQLMNLHIGSSEVLIHVLAASAIDSEVTAEKCAADAPAFVGAYVLKGRIHVTNPEFTGFVVIDPIGVATGWKERA